MTPTGPVFGTRLTVLGTGFSTKTSFVFGTGYTAPGFSCGPDACLVIAPRHAAGLVDVRAIVNGVESLVSRPADEFRYLSSTWRVQRTPTYAASDGNTLVGVSCPSSSFCVATGYYLHSPGPRQDQTLVETQHSNLGPWQITASPNATTNDSLAYVSCTASTFCAAEGVAASAAGTTQALVEMWNGSAWAIAPTPSPTGASNVDLNAGISCTSATFCLALGSYQLAAGGSSLLAETFDGTSWSITSPPVQVPSVGDPSTQRVSCVSPTFCVVVGYYADTSKVLHTLVETFDGSSWMIMPSPDVLGSNEVLNDVSCVSPSMCMAVGRSEGASQDNRVLVETYNGSSWAISPAPNAHIGLSDALTAVSCSVDRCLVVGYYWEPHRSGVNDSFTDTLVESFDGSNWHVVPSPSPAEAPDQTLSLSAVSCGEMTLCAAAGFVPNAGPPSPLVEEGSGV